MINPDDWRVSANPYLDDMRLSYAWPGVLTKKLNLSGHHNDAVPGQSNDSIAKRAIIWLTTHWIDKGRDPKDLFVVISWTSMFRWEFFDKSNPSKLSTIHFGHQPPDHYTKEFQQFWKYIAKESGQSVYEHWMKFSSTILQMQSFLKLHGFPYVMSLGVGPSPTKLIAKTYPEFNEFVPEQAKKFIGDPTRWIDVSRFHKMLDRDAAMTEYLWAQGLSKGTGNAVAPNGHPYADGHKMWADHIHSWIMNNNLMEIPE